MNTSLLGPDGSVHLSMWLGRAHTSQPGLFLWRVCGEVRHPLLYPSIRYKGPVVTFEPVRPERAQGITDCLPGMIRAIALLARRWTAQNVTRPNPESVPGVTAVNSVFVRTS